MRAIQSSVKARTRPQAGPAAARLAILLDVLSPWDGISLTYRQLAAELGKPVTEAAVKKWPQRNAFPLDVANVIVKQAKARGIAGVTLEWVLLGEGVGPRKGSPAPPAARQPLDEPHGRDARQIAAVLEADLAHNEFGQWSSVEVQRTVLWALKDLARRLRAQRFEMGKTFEFTDEWARRIGLPVRPLDRT
ncbi:MAG: hypothetical protein DMD48_09355 [Gemmatimonadetes bacterium]|nr:MAG: hypothetical protein DMD48_09355 [Gemmatimonadota bacterium]